MFSSFTAPKTVESFTTPVTSDQNRNGYTDVWFLPLKVLDRSPRKDSSIMGITNKDYFMIPHIKSSLRFHRECSVYVKTYIETSWLHNYKGNDTLDDWIVYD